MFSVIVFIHRAARLAGKRLHNAIRDTEIGRDYEVCTTFVELEARLKLPEFYGEPDLFVLLADTRERLRHFVTMRHHMYGKQVLLIVPDSGNDTISSGHRLQPRFLTTLAGGFEDIAAVLSKKYASQRRNSWKTQTSVEQS